MTDLPSYRHFCIKVKHFLARLPAGPDGKPLSINGSPCKERKGRVVHPKNMREGKTQGARRKRQGPGVKALAFATEKSRSQGGKCLCYKLTL